MLKVKGKISYRIKPTHPAFECLEDWTEGKVYTYEDVYTFHWYDELEDYVFEYIIDDLKLVAGGGYNWEHISDIKFEFCYPDGRKIRTPMWL